MPANNNVPININMPININIQASEPFPNNCIDACNDLFKVDISDIILTKYKTSVENQYFLEPLISTPLVKIVEKDIGKMLKTENKVEDILNNEQKNIQLQLESAINLIEQTTQNLKKTLVEFQKINEEKSLNDNFKAATQTLENKIDVKENLFSELKNPAIKINSFTDLEEKVQRELLEQAMAKLKAKEEMLKVEEAMSNMVFDNCHYDASDDGYGSSEIQQHKEELQSSYIIQDTLEYNY